MSKIVKYDLNLRLEIYENTIQETTVWSLAIVGDGKLDNIKGMYIIEQKDILCFQCSVFYFL